MVGQPDADLAGGDAGVCVVKGAVPRAAWPRRLHVATRTFQAIRIAVNDEMQALTEALPQAASLLAHPLVAGVCVASGAIAERPVVRALAECSGAILPLITHAEVQRADRLWRFCTEQTLTINTAAAGGNAELLAAAGGHQPLAKEAGGG